MNPNPHMTRKEIAAQLGVSVDTVERHEKKWGLDKLRSRVCQKPVLYWRQRTITLLTNRGLLAD
jgi:FixJ family two-component response regulator